MISHDRRCIFTHVPKTAGKSVRFLFGIPEFEYQYQPGDANVEYPCGHKRLEDFADCRYFTEYFKFSFVRNPFDRVVSSFFYLSYGGCNEEDQQFCTEYLAEYKHDFAAFAENLPALTFATHFQPQIHWLCDTSGHLLTDFVGRYETLEQDVGLIGVKLGLIFPALPRLNPSAHSDYRTYYRDSATVRRIAQAYGSDLELFRYRLD
jgi:chondroitin 4-sulfotransferase 11